MGLKESAVVVLLIALFMLLLGLLTGGLIFYGTAVALSLVMGADYYLLSLTKRDLQKNLVNKRGFSRSEIFLGSPTQLICRLTYSGSAIRTLKVTQKLDRALRGNADWDPVRLTPGSSAYLKTTLSPAESGLFLIRPPEVSIGSWFFTEAFPLGKDLPLSVYVSIGNSRYRAGPSGLRARKSAGIFDATVERRGRGLDFLAIRRYEGGDSMKRVDWIRSARANDLMVREYEDDQPLPTFFLVDLDHSMGSGGEQTGIRLAVGLVVPLVNATIANGERIGFAGFSAKGVVHFMRPAMGIDHLFNLRALLSNLKPAGDSGRLSRHGQDTLPYDIFRVIGGDPALNAFIDEATRDYIANTGNDGFSRAMVSALRSLNTPARIVIITNLSMGMVSLLNGARIAEYYGHHVTVVLVPHLWLEDAGHVAAESQGALAALRSRGLEAVVMSPGEDAGDVIARGGLIRFRSATRRM